MEPKEVIFAAFSSLNRVPFTVCVCFGISNQYYSDWTLACTANERTMTDSTFAPKKVRVHGVCLCPVGIDYFDFDSSNHRPNFLQTK